MLDNGQISSRQLSILFLIFTMGDSVLILPTIVAGEAKQDAWISGILSLFFGAAIVFLYHRVGRMYPEHTLIENILTLLGKWIGSIVALLVIFYGMISIGALLREIGDFMTSQIMVETPITAIMILMIVVVGYAVRMGLESIARSVEIFFPWLVLLFTFLLALLVPQIDPEHVKPVFEGGIKPILRGAIPFTSYPFIETFMILMYLPFVKNKHEIQRSLFIGAGLGGLVLVVFTLLSILVLGSEMTSNQTYSGYKLATKITAGDIIERVEALLAGIWFITIFFKMILYFYASCLGTTQLFKFKDYKFLVVPMSIITLSLSLIITDNSLYLGTVFVEQWPYYDFTFGIVLLLILLIIGTRKLKKQKT
ncbi:spore germination protein [Fictibacillus nanhaiensis]|uniref:GerAB/ArcD/ProY family transporter n=1 Tax=Fictibacillus nanhaiensis TaxID=742169 RepID=UPI001C9654C3|nr:endospore germination permease [Fictibacillus nanhaiensis]MBY6037698.1 spore germination protein [Fictibacillus nanhaiensis]